MQDDLVVLLEWLNANGINEIFNNDVNDCSDTDTHNIKKSGDLNTLAHALVEQQNNVRKLNPLFTQVNDVKNIADQLNSIDNIINFINNCDVYSNFRRSAQNTIIFGGNIKSKILIINDLPDEVDDANNCIFGEDSGILLKKMFESINIDDNEYCLLNSFFWRLPGNRNPIKEELEICKPLVDKIISLIKPKLIIFTGNYSISTIYENNKNLISIRGKFFDYSNCYLCDSIKITATYSPKFLLKNKIKKADAWHDLLNIKSFLELK